MAELYEDTQVLFENFFSKVDILRELIWLFTLWQLCKHWVCTWSEPAIKNQAELILKRTLVTTVLVSAMKDMSSASWFIWLWHQLQIISARQNMKLIT